MTDSALSPYNKSLAEAGALVCWDNGDGPLRYVGPTTDQSCCGCFLWVGGRHKGSYAAYKAGDLRMAPLPYRANGWYWVRMLDFGNQYGDWVPAEWRQESRSWSSTLFSGIPDSEMIVSDLIVFAQSDRDEVLGLLRGILEGDVGRQTLDKLAEGQSTETEEGRIWLAAKAILN